MKTQQFLPIVTLLILLLPACQKKEQAKSYTCSCKTKKKKKNSSPTYQNISVYGTHSEAAKECSKYNKTSQPSLFANSYGQPATFVAECSLKP